MVIADTGFWLALASRTDANRARAKPRSPPLAPEGGAHLLAGAEEAGLGGVLGHLEHRSELRDREAVHVRGEERGTRVGRQRGGRRSVARVFPHAT